MKWNFGRSKSKFGRIFPFLTGGLKISTEGLFDFLDSTIDALILHNASALALPSDSIGEIGEKAYFTPQKAS